MDIIIGFYAYIISCMLGWITYIFIRPIPEPNCINAFLIAPIIGASLLIFFLILGKIVKFIIDEWLM